MANYKKKSSFPFEYAPENYCELGKKMYCDMMTYGITQKSIAKGIGRSQTLVSHIMRGDFPKSPMIPVILKYIEQRKLEFERSESVG